MPVTRKDLPGVQAGKLAQSDTCGLLRQKRQ